MSFPKKILILSLCLLVLLSLAFAAKIFFFSQEAAPLHQKELPPPNKTTPEHVSPAPSQKTVKEIFPIGDFVPETRTPEEICERALEKARKENTNLQCALSPDSISFAASSKECADSGSVAGCFVCIVNCF